jgi:hypothetical protein
VQKGTLSHQINADESALKSFNQEHRDDEFQVRDKIHSTSHS